MAFSWITIIHWFKNHLIEWQAKTGPKQPGPWSEKYHETSLSSATWQSSPQRDFRPNGFASPAFTGFAFSNWLNFSIEEDQSQQSNYFFKSLQLGLRALIVNFRSLFKSHVVNYGVGEVIIVRILAVIKNHISSGGK